MAYLYHTEMLMVGAILLSAMTFAGIKLWLKRRKENLESQQDLFKSDNVDPNSEQNS